MWSVIEASCPGRSRGCQAGHKVNLETLLVPKEQSQLQDSGRHSTDWCDYVHPLNHPFNPPVSTSPATLSSSSVHLKVGVEVWWFVPKLILAQLRAPRGKGLSPPLSCISGASTTPDTQYVAVCGFGEWD